MITEAVRVVADWFEHGTHGVNALMASVPREADVALPASITVYDETRDGLVAREQIPETLPALLVASAASPVDQMPVAMKPFPGDCKVDVLVRYATQGSDTAAVTCESHVVFRCVMRSINRLMMTSAGQTARMRGTVAATGVQVMGVERVQVRSLYQTNADAMVTMGLLITLNCRDLFTTGA